MQQRTVFSTLPVMFLLLFAVIPVARSETPPAQYVSKNYGISFIIPMGMRLYTIENPGPLASQIGEKDPFILVNPKFTEENINVKLSLGISESDLIGFEKLLNENPNMNLPMYQRESVRSIYIGAKKNKKAVEHIFIMKGNILGKLRHVTFVHKNRGFTFTCATAVDRYEETNREIFSTIFDTMKFQ